MIVKIRLPNLKIRFWVSWYEEFFIACPVSPEKSFFLTLDKIFFNKFSSSFISVIRFILFL